MLSQRATTRGGGNGSLGGVDMYLRRGGAETEHGQRQRTSCVTSEWRDSEEEEVGRRMVFFGQPRAVEPDC